MFVSLIFIVIAVSVEDECSSSHDERGNATHNEHRQAVHLTCAGN